MSKFKKSIFIFLLTTTILFVVGALSYTGLKMTQRYAPLVDAVIEMKYELTMFHLWFEEKLQGDASINEQQLWAHLDNAEWYIKAMLTGGGNEEHQIEPVGYTVLEKLISTVQAEIKQLRETAKFRMENRQGSMAGSGIDQEFDINFTNSIKLADIVEKELKEHIDKELLMYRSLSIALAASIALIGLAVGFVYCRNEKIKEQLHQKLNATNKNLEALVDQRTKEFLLAKETAEKASLTKSNFISSMSHEFRTPLNAILGFSQLLELEEKEKDKIENIKEITKAGHHLLNLVNDILDMARIESGKFDVHVEPCSLNDILDDCINIVSPLAVSNNIRLINNVTKSPLHQIYVDERRFKQVLINLLSNAIKYNTDNGKVIIDYTITDDNKTCLSISDTGIGMTVEQQEKLFIPFERGGMNNGTVEGIGLGLVISNELLNLMGGSVLVDSKIGKGSTFTICLPQK